MEKILQQAFERWDEIYKNGCSDPTWSDGCNLNLVRNHILYYKKQIEDAMEPENYPLVYHRETPEKVPYDYMARADEISTNAKLSLESYNKNKDLQYLLKKITELNKREIEETCIENVINYSLGLKDAIARDDLITMRRHESPERYLSSFRNCAIRVKEIKPMKKEQISIFDLGG